jgi:hypothetical protein
MANALRRSIKVLSERLRRLDKRKPEATFDNADDMMLRLEK